MLSSTPLVRAREAFPHDVARHEEAQCRIPRQRVRQGGVARVREPVGQRPKLVARRHRSRRVGLVPMALLHQASHVLTGCELTTS